MYDLYINVMTMVHTKDQSRVCYEVTLKTIKLIQVTQYYHNVCMRTYMQKPCTTWLLMARHKR